ncbi:hypothetical protein BH10PSE2_BH10PSE2_09810 [soil metagenome]
MNPASTFAVRRDALRFLGKRFEAETTTPDLETEADVDAYRERLSAGYAAMGEVGLAAEIDHVANDPPAVQPEVLTEILSVLQGALGFQSELEAQKDWSDDDGSGNF